MKSNSWDFFFLSRIINSYTFTLKYSRCVYICSNSSFTYTSNVFVFLVCKFFSGTKWLFNTDKNCRCRSVKAITTTGCGQSNSWENQKSVKGEYWMTGRPRCVNSRNPHSKVCDFVEKVYMEFLTQTTFLPLEKSLTKFTDT